MLPRVLLPVPLQARRPGTLTEPSGILAKGVKAGDKYDRLHISRCFDEYGEREWERLEAE